MVSPGTSRALIESALFDPVCVRKTSRGMGLSTDASYAFERGCDAEMVITALKRLIYLAEGSGGAVRDAGGAHALGFVCVDGELPEKRRVTLRLSEVRKQLNAPRLEEIEMVSRLKNLGYGLEAVVQPKGAADKEFSVSVPSWRLWDARNEEDLVEDFVRSHGLNRVRLALPPLDYETAEPNESEKILSRVEPALRGNGFVEVITRGTYSAEDAALIREFNPRLAAGHITVKNALERNFSHMKISNVLHLCRVAEANLRRGLPGVKIYEFGRLFSSKRGDNQAYDYERDTLTLAASGRWCEHEFRKPESLEEVLALFKGALEAVFQSFGCEMEVRPGENPLLHPGAQAQVGTGRITCGFFGVVHPGIKDRMSLKQDVLYAELETSELLRIIAEGAYRQPIDYPSIRRDITLKVGASDPAARIIRLIEGMKKADLQEIAVTDHFRKPEEDFRRITFRLTFQSAERTLEHAAIDALMQEILSELGQKHGLELAT